MPLIDIVEYCFVDVHPKNHPPKTNTEKLAHNAFSALLQSLEEQDRQLIAQAGQANAFAELASSQAVSDAVSNMITALDLGGGTE